MFEATVYKEWYPAACVDLALLCSLGMLVEITFIFIASRKVGWTSNFSYAILIIVACMGLNCYICLLLETVLSFLIYFCNFNIPGLVFQLLANTKFSCLCFVIFLNISLSFHRFLYTIFPTEARFWWNQNICKAYVVIVPILHVTFICMVTFVLDDETYSWDPTVLSIYKICGPSGCPITRSINTFANYATGVFNFFVYGSVFVILYNRRQLSFKKNKELRLTIYVGIIVLIEIFYTLYWSLMDHSDRSAIAIHRYTLITYAYNLAIIAPYFIMNSEFRNRICCCTSAKESVTASRSNGSRTNNVNAVVPMTKSTSSTRRHQSTIH